MKKAGRKPILAQFEDYPEYHQDHIPVIWTLKEWHDVYVEEEDLTGYRAAMKLVGNWTENSTNWFGTLPTISET